MSKMMRSMWLVALVVLTATACGTSSVSPTVSDSSSNGRCGNITVGRQVEVKGTRQANGSVLASKIEIDD